MRSYTVYARSPSPSNGMRGAKRNGANPRAKNIICDANVFLVIYHLHRRNYFDKSLSTMGLRRFKFDDRNSTVLWYPGKTRVLKTQQTLGTRCTAKVLEDQRKARCCSSLSDLSGRRLKSFSFYAISVKTALHFRLLKIFLLFVFT